MASDLLLRTLSAQYPTQHHVIARLARLRAALTLPRGPVHIFSDVHGEHEKLRHIINNGSGLLRPIVEGLFPHLDRQQHADILNTIYYPLETWMSQRKGLTDARAELRKRFDQLLEVLRTVARGKPFERITATFPEPFVELLTELMLAPFLGRSPAFVDALLAPVLEHDDGPHVLRRLARVIRNLVFDEIIVAGDLGDRGPRMDKVTAYLMHQPNLRIVWGNHDVLWMGAGLAHPALIANVLRISLRYGRVRQLEEGYGISLTPLARLARTRYGDDPCERFQPRVQHLEDAQILARMQKAIAIIQFKLEGQLLERHPEYGMDARRLLHRIRLEEGTVTLPDGSVHPLLDTHWPTLNPTDPYALSEDEADTLEHLKTAFWESPTLWLHISFIFRHGASYLIRDGHLIFHAAYPVDEDGKPLSMLLEGEPRSGRALFDALDDVVLRAWRDRRVEDLDRLWYLWAGPHSPLFGKDRMATFERYLIADKSTHTEVKNPYFKLIRDPVFCEKVLAAFGIDAEHGLIVNGHVPVKIEKGENPVKSHRAVVIDGAFAAAYGDHGYTLLLTPEQTCLAEHGHFHSVEHTLRAGSDMVPDIRQLRGFSPARCARDVPETGDPIREEIEALQQLLDAYRHNQIRERESG